MLNGKLELHGLDVEVFVTRRVEFLLRKHNVTLDAHRREDLLAHCISELWIASLEYDPGRYRDFRQFSNAVVFNKAIDWLRQNIGRAIWRFSDHVHERNILTEKPSTVVSFELPVGEGESRLGDVVAFPPSRLEADHHSDLLGRLAAERRSARSEDKRALLVGLCRAAA